jgi:DNA-binding LacI/PurR family transcriptional regulator
MAATLRDVALLAGVSFKTVSNVVNEHPHVRAATRQRVLAAIAELDYAPNPSARSLRLGRTGAIGLAVPELNLPYFTALAAEVIEAAARRDLVVVTEQTNRSRDREIDALRGARRRMTDGLLFSPIVLGDADADLLRPGSPVVLLGEHLFTRNVDHVTMRNVDAARAATEHLLALGHRRIAVLGAHPGEVVGTAGLRLRGYRAALEAAGVPFDPALVVEADLWYRREGAAAMGALLGTGTPFTAAFAFNDTLALGAMHRVQEAGMRVPEDVSIVGFDDTDDGEYSMPTLTTVDGGAGRSPSTPSRCCRRASPLRPRRPGCWRWASGFSSAGRPEHRPPPRSRSPPGWPADPTSRGAGRADRARSCRLALAAPAQMPRARR